MFPPFTISHIRNQDLESHPNTLSPDFSMNQNEVQQINANITTIDANMHSAIDSKMENLI